MVLALMTRIVTVDNKTQYDEYLTLFFMKLQLVPQVNIKSVHTRCLMRIAPIYTHHVLFYIRITMHNS